MSSGNPYARSARIRSQMDANLVANRPQRKPQPTTPLLNGVPALPTFAEIVRSKNLIDTAVGLRQQGRKAPGLDGVQLEDISHDDLCSLMSDLSEELNRGGYFPSEARLSRRQKSSGGFRTISIRSLTHKVVSKALQLKLQPFFEQEFLPVAFGSRTKRGPWDVLLALEAEIDKGNTIVFQGDIVKAYNNVSIPAVMNCYRKYITEESLLALLERNLRGTSVEQKTVDVDQGAADSPQALRLLLHENVDLLYDVQLYPPVFSFVDNYFGATTSESIARAALQHVSDLLGPIGMELNAIKGDSIIDLTRGDSIIVLGLQLSLRNGRVQYRVPEANREELRELLREAHEHPNSWKLAVLSVEGWLNHFGPAYGDQAAEVAAWAKAECLAAGFREFPWSRIPEVIEKCHARWLKRREGRSSCAGTLLSTAPSTPAPQCAPAQVAVTASCASPVTSGEPSAVAGECPF